MCEWADSKECARRWETLLNEAKRRQASDLHLTPGAAPVYRIFGKLCFSEEAALTDDNIKGLFRVAAGKAQQKALTECGQTDFSFTASGVRCRINAFRQRGVLALALRLIVDRMPTLQELQIPDVVVNLLRRPGGLLLISGVTGSGKSTTLAALTEWINHTRSAHIITLEEPIEYLYCRGRSLVHQREIPTDAASFAAGLRAALREDPDVLLIGEMRDAATASAAVTAAETGHFVFATLHAADAVQAIDRILDLFPPHQQPQIRAQLAMTLLGVVAQRLMERKDGGGRVAAREILLATGAVRNLIREGKTHQLLSAIQSGGRAGMQTMEAALADLVRNNKVASEIAAVQARDPEAFFRLFSPDGATVGMA